MPDSADLDLSRHAQRQMRRRRISRVEIAEALTNPETTYPSAEGPGKTVVLGSTTTHRRLKVVVRTDDWNRIVTVAGRDEDD